MLLDKFSFGFELRKFGKVFRRYKRNILEWRNSGRGRGLGCAGADDQCCRQRPINSSAASHRPSSAPEYEPLTLMRFKWCIRRQIYIRDITNQLDKASLDVRKWPLSDGFHWNRRTAGLRERRRSNQMSLRKHHRAAAILRKGAGWRYQRNPAAADPKRTSLRSFQN